MKAVVLFGSPGSGKGTQAGLLTQCLGVPHISTGDMLRERIRLHADSTAKMSATIHSGALVSDAVVKAMVEERLSEPDAARGFVLDGYPRTIPQADHLCAWFDARGVRELVIYLAVDYNVVIARMTGRRQCPRCGTVYNLISKPPRVDELCDLDGERLKVREDDSEPVIRRRLDDYERQTRPLVEYFRAAGRRVVEVDASADPPHVVSQICQAMEPDDCSKNCC
jgi:adenylate kinase